MTVRFKSFSFTLLFTLIILSAGCVFDGGPDADPEPATEILAVVVEPAPVIFQGDTVTFTCIIKDSLATNVGFSWRINGEYSSTPTNQIIWPANVQPDKYSVKVFVSRPSYATVDDFVDIIIYTPQNESNISGPSIHR